jgi:hypothetical protein
MTRPLLAVLALLLGAACASSTTPATPPGVTTIEGTAHNVKGGAVVIDAQGKATRIGGIGAWPDELHGRAIVVTGRLETRGGTLCVHDPVPCQGISGPHEVLVEARWQAR